VIFLLLGVLLLLLAVRTPLFVVIGAAAKTAPPARLPVAPSPFARCRCHRKTASTSRRSTFRSSFGSFTTRKRNAKGKESVHCLHATLGNTSSKCSAVSCARRAPHEGHHPRDLHENVRREAQEEPMT